MNQITKQVLAIFVVPMISLHAETCPGSQFQVEGSLCCSICDKGMYVSRNCSNGPEGYTGVQCSPCSRCEDAGLREVSQCTLFSDAQCHARELPQLTIYGCSSVVFCVLALALISAAFVFRRFSESDGSSTGDSFHLDDVETV